MLDTESESDPIKTEILEKMQTKTFSFGIIMISEE